MISSLWGSIVKKQSDSVGEDTDHDDLLKHMEDLEEIEIRAPQITPILSKKINVNSPRCSPNIAGSASLRLLLTLIHNTFYSSNCTDE